MDYALLKALHVIFMVAWMASALYLGRLLIYFVEAQSKPDAERAVLQAQFGVMIKRLMYGIGHPAMAFTIVFGVWVMMGYGLMTQPWFHFKLTLALAFMGYYIYLGRIYKNLQKGKAYTPFYLRVLNEVGTAFLISIVVVAYLKSALSPVGGVLVFVGTLAGLTLAVYLMNRGKRNGVE